MNKHTPGPWSIETVRHRNGEFWIVAPCSEGTRYGPMVAHVFGISTTEKEKEANANLIVAATEMLEALETIMQKTDDTVLFKIASRAIKKAKGEE